MLQRLFGLLIVMGIITIIASSLSGISILDFIILAIIIAPLTLLNTHLNENELSRSIIFNQNRVLFRVASFIFTIALIIGIIQYGIANGIGITIVYLVVGFIIQSGFYAFIKTVIPGEIFLVILEIIGLALFYSVTL